MNNTLEERMSAKKLTDFLKTKAPEDRAAIQGYVPGALRKQVLGQMRKDKGSGQKVTWDSFLEAACRAYLSERKSV